MSSDDMRVLHPGWDPRRRVRDRRRRPRRWLLLAVLLVAGIAVGASLLRMTPESPSNAPAFPPEAFTAPPAPPSRTATASPAWDEGSPQVHPPTTPTTSARVAGATDEAPECGIDDLSLVNDGWDAATGNTWTTVTATNVGDAPCLLGGWPQIRITQGDPLALTVQQVSTGADGRPAPPKRLVLDPMSGASLTIWWRGYRAAADSDTPQRLSLRVGAGDWRDIPLDRGPAPFDIVDGGQLELHAWEPTPLPGTPGHSRAAALQPPV